MNELCSIAHCDVAGPPEIICDLCNDMPEWPEHLTVGEICAYDPCFSPKHCAFCKLIGEFETLPPPSSSESLFIGSKNTSLLVKEEVKNSKHPHCRYVWCCDSNKHVCYEDPHKKHPHCSKVWCCDYIQNCHRKSSSSDSTEVEQSFSKTIQSSFNTITTSTGT